MNSVNQKIIRHKVGLLNLAAELGNVSYTCKVRDTFYRYQADVETGGIEALMVEIKLVWQVRVYGVRKVWRQLQCEGITVARCTVERLMRRLSLQDTRRSKTVRTTIADRSAASALGVRLHLSIDLAKLVVRSLRHQCVFPTNRRPAGQQ